MKTILRKFAVVALLLGTYSTYATENTEVTPTNKIVEKGDKIIVTDASGEVIYNGTINYNGNLTKLFDFSQLRDGEYTIEINKDFIIEITSITVKNNTVTIESAGEKQIFKPVIRLENSRVLISKLALDSSNMSVKLYYKDEVIHTDAVKGGKVLNRIYQLDKNRQGEYTAVIRANDRVYVENFRI